MRYDFFDEGSAGRLMDENALPAFPKTVTALHVGSFSLAEEPCGSALEALVKREQRDCVISLDPNIRPAVIKNRDGYLARIDRMVEMTDIVRLSAGDLAWLAPDAEFHEVATRWLDRGAKLVVLTRGADGAEARSHRGTAKVPAAPATMTDPVGAGDAFTAALLARLSEKKSLAKDAIGNLGDDALADALAFAAKAAAITVSRSGADSPWLRELS